MQAMRLEEVAPIESSPLRLTQLPEPWPEPGEIRIRVSACAVSRADLHLIEGDLPLPRKRLPIVPGHGIVGTVDLVGRDCRRFRAGQKVGITWLHHTCGTCVYCSSGQENLCDLPQFTGCHADGGFAEYAIVPEGFAFEIPVGLAVSAAAPLLSDGVFGHRTLKRADLAKGGTLGLFGFGSSAHLILQMAKAQGARIYVVARSESQRDLAKTMGADWVGASAFDLPRKLDSAVLFGTAGEMVPPVLTSLRKGGTLVLAGLHLSSIPALDYDKHLFYEKKLCSVTSHTRGDVADFLADALKNNIRAQVCSYSLTETNRALLDLKSDKINGSPVITFP
jgi:propanol-preferring alcohol dehydrogenase